MSSQTRKRRNGQPNAPRSAAPAASLFPKRLRHSTLRPDVVYELSSDLYAQRTSAGVSAPREAAVMTLEGDAGELYRVYRGAPARPRDARSEPGAPPAVYPVYAQESGYMVIPTGRLLVRFDDAVSAESRAADLNRAGYHIAQALSYAPNAAWIVANGDSLEAALNNIAQLEGLPDVRNVEPQLIAPRANKT